MSVEIFTPATETQWLEARLKDVTSTDVAALFGLSPYLTPYELWHRKKSQLMVRLEPSDRMKWGNRLQDAIALGIADDHGLTVRPMTEYIRRTDLRIGSSFDYSVGDPEDGLLEIKNVDALQFRDGWVVDGDYLEAPPHIELQVQHQLFVSDRKYAKIGALIGGNRVVVIDRNRDDEIIESILSRVRQFWASIDNDCPPIPDLKHDAEFVAKLYSSATPGKVKDVSEDAQMAALADRYRALGEEAKRVEEERMAVKARMLIAIGDAERAVGNNYTISASVVGPAKIEYQRESYRNFRVNFKKEKKL